MSGNLTTVSPARCPALPKTGRRRTLGARRLDRVRLK
jgi:hypothetical protein